VTAHIEDRSGESVVANLRTVVDDLAHAGFDAVAVDLTTEDVDAVGYKVVRVVVPGLQPLDNDHTCRHLGGARLRATFNPDPHPFP
jgi:ribosomal protein S12 methylthiotransferase accessory factor